MTWGPEEGQKPPPLRARLHRYKLTTDEFALLTAMCEHSSDGSVIRPSIARLAAYAKLKVRQVQRLIHGYEVGRGHVPGLIERGILTQLAAKTRKPAIYRLNEEALLLDPRMRIYLGEEDQPLLPGILKPGKKGAPIRPISDAAPGVTVTPPPPSGGVTVTDEGVTVTTEGVTVTDEGVTVTPHSLSNSLIDSLSDSFTRELCKTPLQLLSGEEKKIKLQRWQELNSWTYARYCQQIARDMDASVGSANRDYRRIVLRAAARTGVPDHIALALEGIEP
jgi:hypothetical protein